jgi:hypothetical protein
MPNALHGGLTPPALGRTCRRRCRWAILADESDTFPTGAYAPRSWRWYNDHPPEERRFLRCTSARSTTNVSPPWFSRHVYAHEREKTADSMWAALPSRAATPRLRPPLLALVQRPSTGRTTILRCTSARSTKSGGRSPPWFGDQHCAASRTVMRPRDGRARAAGVSPRWFPNAPAVADVFFRMVTRASHGWFTPAALGWACGSCCRWRFVSGVALAFAWLVYVSRCWKFVWRL